MSGAGQGGAHGRELFRRALFVKPVPQVRRVVFIATPHGGSYLAGNWRAHRVARFIKMPKRVLNAVGEVVQGNPGLATAGGRIPTAVDDMTPRSLFVQQLGGISLAPGVASNSIVAVQGDGPPDEGDDGVVQYASAHRTDVESEVVVRSPHSCQSHPDTVAEVRRILRRHLDAHLAGLGAPASALAAAR